MRVDPKALVRRLDPACTQALEEAVASAASGRFYEIVVEHLLLALLEPADGEAAAVLSEVRRDRRRATTTLQNILQRMRTGNAGRPVFSEGVFQLLEEAWLVASVEHGRQHLRPADVLLEFATRGNRYTAETIPELTGIPLEDLRRAVASHSEPPQSPPAATPGAAPTAPGVAPGTPAAGGGGREMLTRFTISYTDRAKAGKIDPIFGRDAEIRQMIDILARRRKNNPILVGEPGVGKTALVEGLARAIVAGDVPSGLKDTELLGLDLGLLMAGAGVRGELENRLKKVIAEVKASATPIILFIDEAHTIMGASGDNAELPNLLKPELARGELRTLAATTWSEYKKYFEKDPALARRFQLVKVGEPDQDTAILMLRGLRDMYSKAHGVVIRDEAVVAAVELSERYISGRQLPDKAIDLIDTASARVKIEQDAPPEALTNLRSRLAAVDFELDGVRRDLADGLHRDGESDLVARAGTLQTEVAALEQRWADEKAGVAALNAAQAAFRESPADGRDAALKTLEQARTSLATLAGESPLIHAEVDRRAVARIVADWTGIPVGKMRRSSVAELLDLEVRITARIKGQDDAVKTASEAVRMSAAGVRDPGSPTAVMLFVGPSGVGKTELALALADQLYGGERQMTTINMSEFQEKHSVSRLIGSPPGYVGYGEGGVLTEAVRQRPYSVVLLDECEKADLEVMNLFYQVFDKGSLSDSGGREVDFRNTLVVLTSNLATDKVMAMHDNGRMPTSDEIVHTIRPILSAHFKPALLARMTVVPFRPMNPEILGQIAELSLRKLGERLRRAHGLVVEFAPELVGELVRRCISAESGARMLSHVLRGSLMPELARGILQRLAGDDLPQALRVGYAPADGWLLDFHA